MGNKKASNWGQFSGGLLFLGPVGQVGAGVSGAPCLSNSGNLPERPSVCERARGGCIECIFIRFAYSHVFQAKEDEPIPINWLSMAVRALLLARSSAPLSPIGFCLLKLIPKRNTSEQRSLIKHAAMLIRRFLSIIPEQKTCAPFNYSN